VSIDAIRLYYLYDLKLSIK